MQDFVGKQIGRYRILQQQGTGGMAVVYQAYDTRLDREVALKVIRTESIPPAQHERLMKRFEQEAKTQARFSHPNIVSVFDYGEHEGTPYLVMSYLPSGTLKDRFQGPMPVQEALEIGIAIAGALAYAHDMGVLHRDVKPGNILFNASGQPLLTDFGIAKILENTDNALTGTGLGVGTPEYMAPEQWRGNASEASDQYALGVLLFELLTGEKPYSAETPMAVALKQMTEPIRQPSAIVPDIPREVEKLLYKMLARQPEERFDNMADVHSALSQVVEFLSHHATAEEEKPVSSEDGREAETLDFIQPPARKSKTKTSQKKTKPQQKPKPKKLKTQSRKIKPWMLWTGIALVILCVLGAILTALLGGLAWLNTSREDQESSVVSQRRTERAEEESREEEDPEEIIIESSMVEPTSSPSPTLSQTPSPTSTLNLTPSLTPTLTLSPTVTFTATITPTQTQTLTPTLEVSFSTNSRDSAPMILIPEGSFVMGESSGEAGSDEIPAHTVRLDAFWIYQFEVTNNQFKSFINATGYKTIAEQRGDSLIYNGSDWVDVDGAYWEAPDGPGSSIVGIENDPVVHIGWEDADAYCAWAGGRLPTEAEWEKAARGTDRRNYPWGDAEPTCSLANYLGCAGEPLPVGSSPSGASPYQVMDMGGNVWEWVSDWYGSSYYYASPASNPTGPDKGSYKVFRGGSWFYYPGYLQTWQRHSIEPDHTDFNLGFRCVINP